MYAGKGKAYCFHGVRVGMKTKNKKSSAPKGRLGTCEQEIPNTSRAIGAAEIANN